MISYSDYILAEKPWAYWPMSDSSLFGMYTDAQKIIDVSGNERHLNVVSSDKVSFKVPFTSHASIPNFPSDAIPVRGISVNGSTASTPLNTLLTEGSSYLYLPSGLESHLNDVTLDVGFVSHQIRRRKVRFEFLLGLPISAVQENSSCSISQYPVLNVGGLTLWVRTIYFKPCDTCSCVRGASCFFLTYQTYETWYSSLNGPNIFSQYNQLELWSSGYFISYDGEVVQVERDSSLACTESAGTGLINKGRRFIVEFESLSDKEMDFLLIIDDTQKMSSHIVLPDYEIDSLNRVIRKIFSYDTCWTFLAIYSCSVVSNLSLWYDRVLDVDDYVPQSWEALKAIYLPRFTSRPTRDF